MAEESGRPTVKANRISMADLGVLLVNQYNHDFPEREYEEKRATNSFDWAERELCFRRDLQAQSISPPAEQSVRLVNGNTSCSGTVEVFYRGEWLGLCSIGWSMRETKVVCRELGCGNAVAESRGPLVEEGRRGGVTLWSRCSGDESTIRECGATGSDCYGGYHHHHVTCSQSVQLVDGAGLCSGRLEVKSNQSNQSWASVCEADFDQQDAEVVCGELGCGAPAALQGGLYGEGEGQTWDKEFQCKGNESLLLDCDTSDRKNNTCLPGNAVGLTCSEPDGVRLVGGGSRCAGGLEQYDQGEWRTVGAEYWNKEDVAAVVCRQLGCDSTVSVLPGNTTRSLFSVDCSGSEPSLRECRRMYFLFPGLTVICSDLLVQPDIFLTDSMGGVSRGHEGPEVFRGYNFTITCSTQPQYPGGSFLLTFTGSNRTQTQPAVNHSAAFLFPAADGSHQGNYSCVYDNYVFSHNFSSESELLTLTVTASPLPAFIIRHVVVLLILLTAITTFYLYYKTTRRQKRVNRVSSMVLYVDAMEMVSLSSRAEAGPGEERAAQGTE
ncbi:CD5 antigen-like [Coregonus clupeaformis]|uniref:CD5 antigen-like n=1 Tax=Coregonus clupeaformis TaxID=59861 RepID=UPI001E1C390B|nr:CD5 antigen-like [Coregonus clupeaformis]